MMIPKFVLRLAAVFSSLPLSPQKDDGDNGEYGENNKEINELEEIREENQEIDKSNVSRLEEETRDDTPNCQQIVPEQPEAHQDKQPQRKAALKKKRDAHPMSKSLAEAGTSFETGVRRSTRKRVPPLEFWRGERLLYGRLEGNKSNASRLEEETRDDTPNSQQIVPVQPEAHQDKRPQRKAALKKKRDAHPMSKSLAEAGTSFETGVRRSTRKRVPPLEFWRGERLLYRRLEGSEKLLGVKYFSPREGKLKVKPFILSESVEFKMELELAARY